MAESKRRGEEAVDERLDEAFDDAVDDDALDDGVSDEGGKGGVKVAGRSAKPKSGGDKGGDRVGKVRSDENPGIFGRLLRFIREVVAELRKVIWPTRKELLTYATVVVVFVAVMLTIVGLLDVGFAKAALWVFGGGKK